MNTFANDRRSFVKQLSLAGLVAAVAGMPAMAAAAEKTKRVGLRQGDIILFQGDSITDWGRDKTKTQPNASGALGSGYPLAITTELLRRYAELGLQVYNKGISGHKVYQLADRWDADCLDLKPTVLSILVGVNDYWHTLTGGYKGTLQTYKDDYHRLLERTVKALPGIRLIIMEPYAVRGVKAVDDSWFPTFDGYRDAAREVAKAFGAAFVPLQAIFDRAQAKAPGSYWTIDGVHPSVAGEGLIAHAWLDAIG
jgi:lysophospholipase L1-like esterase